MVGVAGRRCLVEGCRGDMQNEVSLPNSLKRTGMNAIVVVFNDKRILLHPGRIVIVLGRKFVHTTVVLQSYIRHVQVDEDEVWDSEGPS